MSPGGELGRLQQIFERALELDPDERARYLGEACGNDAGLRRRIEGLLAADAEPRLDPPSAIRTEGLERSGHDLPARMGPFEIVSRIGEGGMGIVYEARQETPRRIVALKVIRPGLASAEVLRRFHQESELLGQLQHPGIAQVHAAGSFEGRPWFAMERIHGLPIDVWVERRQPDVRQRVTLLAAICDAVQHAHDKGIVHRDLKPANILVDEAGQPKILDFGVARATSGDEVMATMHTSTGQIVGTLAYMSPEQVGASGRTVDRRSDVYALGVVLYELLAGRLPYKLHGQPMAEALRIIRDEEPSRLSSVNHRFRGDLETIAAKALAKEPERRYPSAAELASDIRRYLADEPIVARPPSAWYQVVKFARRNRALVGGIMAVVVALVLGTLVATTFAIRESRQRALLEREAYRSAVAAASAEIRLNDGGQAGAILDAVSEALRGWEWRYLRRSADRSLRAIPAGEQFNNVVLSGDGRRFAGIAANGTVTVWDLDSGGRLTTIPGPYDPDKVSLAFSSDAALLYVSDRRTTHTRAVAIDRGSVEWELPYGGVGPLSFAPDGSLVFGSAGLAIAIDPASGAERRRWPIGAAASDIAYLADGRHVAYMSGSGIQIAELPSWKPVFSASRLTNLSATGNRVIGELPQSLGELRDPAGELVVRSAVPVDDVHPLDPDLGLSRAGQGIAIVEVASGRHESMLLGHAGEVQWSRFTPDGRRFVSGARDGTLRTWDAATPPDPSVTLGYSGCFYAISPDGRFCADAGWGYVRLWDTRTGWPVWTRMLSRRGMNSLAFDATSKRVVVVGDDGPIWVLELDRGGEARTLAPLPAGALSVAWSRDGEQILAAGVDGVTRILDARDGRELRTLGDDRASAHVVLPLADGATIATGGRGPNPSPVVWSSGSVLAPGSGGVRLWDRATGRLLRTVDTSAGTVRALAAGPHRLAAGYDDGSLVVWDLASGGRTAAPATGAPVTGLLFDPSEGRLIVGRAGTIEVRELDSLRSLLVLSVPDLHLQSGAFASDGSLVAAGWATAVAVFETSANPSLYPRRALARRLERRHNLLRRSVGDPDLLASLATAPGMDDEERSEALAYARALGNNPNFLNSEALGTVRRTDATRAEYELALRRIRAALPFRPDDLSFLKTLALAELRLGDARAALGTVERCETLLLEQALSPRAVDLAVRAMAEQAIGQREQARRTLERLRVVMGAPAEANEIESQGLLVEAEKVVGGGRIGS